eukprot:21286_3
MKFMERVASKTRHPKIWMQWSSISPQEARELNPRKFPPVHGKPSRGTLLQSMHFEVGYNETITCKFSTCQPHTVCRHGKPTFFLVVN